MTVRVDRRGVLAGIAVLLGVARARAGFRSGLASGIPPPMAQSMTTATTSRARHELDRSRGALRRQVAFAGPYRPGTIVVVNIGERHLYFVEPGGMAMRYSVGVGREEALNFRGNAVIGRKAEWPHWTPTAEMIRRMPIYAHLHGPGRRGGINNPLGARALYLYRGNQDTYFRLHGTIEPGRRSGRRFPAAAFACSITTLSISTTALQLGLRLSVLQEGEFMRAREAGPETDGADDDPDRAEPPGPYPLGPMPAPIHVPPPWVAW